MQMMMNVTIKTIELIALLMVVVALMRFFLRRTLIGRLILLTFKNIHLFAKLCLRMSKGTIKIINTDCKKLNNYMYKKYKHYEVKNQEKKVVNGNNVIDFNKAKKKYS